MSVNASTLVAASSAISSSFDLWEPPHIIKPNWANPIKCTSVWDTSTAQAFSLAEDRYACIDRPSHSLKFSAMPYQKINLLKFRQLLARMASARTLIPLYCDQAIMSASGDTELSLTQSPLLFRFDEGTRVFVVSADFSTFEISKITTIGVSSITVEELDSTFPAGSLVFPAMECQVIPKQSYDMESPLVISANLTCLETEGNCTLSLYNPDTPDLVLGYPVLPDTFNWDAIKMGDARPVHSSMSGRRTITSTVGYKTPFWVSLNYQFTNREDAFSFLAFCQYLQGQRRAFWAASPLNEIEPLLASSTYLLVDKVGELFDWEQISHVAIKLYGQDAIIKEISSAAENLNTFQLNFDEAWAGLDIEDIEAVAPAFLARLTSDELEEEWLTDEVMQISITSLELIEEKTL